MDFKAIPTQFKASGDRSIEGHAAIFGNRDSYGDIIEKGAFARTLSNASRVKVLWQHDPSNPIGKPLEMREDDRGLFVKARIADTTQGRDAMALFDAEVIDELSIGYDAVVEEWDNEKNVRYLKEIRLWEFSPVTWAANELAKITAVKQASDLDLILDRLERLKWAGGRLESDRLRARVKSAISSLDALLVDQTPPVGSPSGTPQPTADTDPNPVHSVLNAASDLNQKLRAVRIAQDLRAFSETLKETNYAV